MARTGALIAGVSAVAFALAFLVIERGSPGMSFPVAFLVMDTVLVLFAFQKSATGPTGEARGAGWIGVGLVVITGLYWGAWFGPWLIAGIVLLGLHVPLTIGLVAGPAQHSG